MKIQYCSDLHLEFIANSRFLKANPLKVAAPVLIIAGDLVPFGELEKHTDFLSWVSDNFEQTYWTPGNHEYYNYDASLRSGSVNEAILPNLHLVNNQAITIGGARVLFTSLWSAISPLSEMEIKHSLNDFHVISYGDERFTPIEYNAFHAESVKFLEEASSAATGLKTIIVTHHVPTLQNYPAEYRYSSINEAFCVSMDEFILRTQPDYWIYGHHHRNTPDFNIGKTQLLTNQLGYVAHNEQGDFVADKVITL